MNLECATGGIIRNYGMNKEILSNVHLAEMSALIENGLLGIYIKTHSQSVHAVEIISVGY